MSVRKPMGWKKRSVKCILVLAVAMILSDTLGYVLGTVLFSSASKSLASVETPVVVLLGGTSGTSTIYAQNTSARASFSGPAYYYPGTVNILTGSFVSGTLSSLQVVDSDRYVVRGSGSGTENVAYNPSSFNLLGTTSLVSGSTSNLASNDGSYMTFNSYPSSFSTTSPTRATIVYQNGAGGQSNVPKERTWNGTVWTAESSLPTSASTLRWIRTAYSTVESRWREKISVTLSGDANLDAYVWNGTAWSLTSNIASVGSTAAAYRSFDMIYEKNAGRGLLVYSTGGGSTDLGYRIWNGTSWLGPYTFDFTATASGTIIYWVGMAAKPTSGSNEIALIALDGTNTDVYGAIWNGTAWASQQQLETAASIATEEDIAVAYEQLSGYATFVWGSGNDVRSRQWSGTGWDASPTTFDPSVNGVPNWITLAEDPASDRLMLSVVDALLDLNTADWSGTAWTVHTEHDAGLNTDAARSASVVWEPSGSKALLVWATDTTNLSYKTWTASGGWTSTSTFNYDGVQGVWVLTRRDPRGVGSAKILVAASDTNLDLFTVRWNGTTLISGVTAANDLTSNTYETFDLRFQILGDPAEFTADVEFQGSSNTNVWTSILWSVDSAWDTGSVTVTLNLYNYTAGAYPSSGNGYSSYASSSTANTDETRNQTISSNPTHFRDGSGTWKVKVKGVKSTSSQFQMKVDWIEYRVTQYNEFKAETEFVFSGITSQTASRLNFTVVIQWSVASVPVTIQLWNYTSSSYVTSGPGYLTYTSSGTASTDETQTLTITSGFSTYVSGGEARMKITGLKFTVTQYDQGTNLDRLIYRAKYDYVLRVRNNSGSQAWNIRLSQYDSNSISRLGNLTIYFHDGSTSPQIRVNDGTFNLSTGPLYSLGISTTIFIATEVEATTAGTSRIDTYLEIYFPGTTVFARYTITFEIT